MKTLAWYQDDKLWTALSPFLFSSERTHDTPTQTDQVVQLLGLKPGGSVLDMCCGQGRFSLELAKRGIRVTGVDRTAAFLELARARASGLDNPCEFILDDALHFRRPETYDAVINLFHSFGYHEREDENAQVLRNAHASLVKGGALLLDLLSRDQALHSAGTPFRQDLGDLSLVSARNFDDQRQRVEDQWILTSKGCQRQFHTSARIYGAQELSDLLCYCGFASVQIKGGLDGRPYAEREGRLIAIATK